MRAGAILNRPKTSLFALAGLGLVLGLVFVTDRPAGGEAREAATLCTKLNVGDEACGRAYLTKAGFDRVFAAVEGAAALSDQDKAVFTEKLRLAGAKRLAPAAPAERITVLRTRIAESSPSVDVDATLQTSRLDQAALFRLMLEDPTGATAEQRLSKNQATRASDGT
jgi:hypothetical protein